jgi:hypothetical protein
MSDGERGAAIPREGSMGIFHHNSKSEFLTHFHAANGDGWAVLTWDCRGDAPRDVLVLRSTHDFAPDEGDPTSAAGQTVVYEGAEEHAHVQDMGLQDGIDYFYTVFAKADDGEWHEQLNAKVTPEADFHWQSREPDPTSDSADKFERMRHGQGFGH